MRVKKLLIALIPFTYLIILLFQKDLSMLADLGRHLKLGEIVLNCLCVPQTNLFSYTNPNFPIVNHEWLAEVIFYLVTQVAGLSGLLIFKMILIITSAVLLYSVALKKGSIFWVTVFALLGITIFSMRFFVMPELFSYLFIALFIFILEKYKTSKKTWLLLLLPFLQILWVNMHIYFILGISIYTLFFLEDVIRHSKFDKKIIIVGIVLILSTFINPSFIKGALLPFTFSTNYGFNVEENNSPFSVLTPNSTNSNLTYTLVMQVVVFEFLLGLFIICFIMKKQWKEILHLGNGITAAYLGLRFTRCISLFGILGFVPLVQGFTLMEEKLQKTMEKSMLNIIKGTILLIVLIIVGLHIKGVIDYKILSFSYVPSAEKAVNFMKETNIRGKIFNNYIIGNYLIYSLYPPEQVYIDARPEAYPASFFDEYWRMMADEAFFNEQVKKHDINAVVFNVAYEDQTKSRPFLIRLLQSPDWVPVFADGTVTILVRNNEINKSVIDNYRIRFSGK